ncbi:MAG: PDZ domain-containing protein [Planctomycetaceae bacterium]|nr:PDZ domain-containing protein [Planctomycetaceae bacterium]
MVKWTSLLLVTLGSLPCFAVDPPGDRSVVIPRSKGIRILIQDADGNIVESSGIEALLPPGGEIKQPLGAIIDADVVAPAEISYVLGVRVVPLQEGVAEHLGLKESQGLIVGEVLEESAAAKAGIQSHDILTAIGETPLESVNGLRELVNASNGEALTVHWLRNGKKHSAEVTPTKPDPQTLSVFVDGDNKLDLKNFSVVPLDGDAETKYDMSWSYPGILLPHAGLGEATQQSVQELKEKVDAMQDQLKRIEELLKKIPAE